MARVHDGLLIPNFRPQHAKLPCPSHHRVAPRVLLAHPAPPVGPSGAVAIMRKTSLVASCCSAACRNSCACAAIVFSCAATVFFSAATDSREDEVRRFTVDFFVRFLLILKKPDWGRPSVRVNLIHTPGTTGIDQPAIPFE